MGLSAVCFLNTPIYEKQTLDVIRAAMPHRNVRPKGALSPTTARLMLFKLVSVHPRPRTNHCRRSSQVSVPETPPKSSKCHQTTPPDRLVTQNPAQLGHAPHQAHRGSPSLPRLCCQRHRGSQAVFARTGHAANDHCITPNTSASWDARRLTLRSVEDARTISGAAAAGCPLISGIRLLRCLRAAWSQLVTTLTMSNMVDY